MKTIKDETGNRFGKLLVLKFSHKENQRTYWICRCDCGKEIIINKANVKNGHTKSCGCYNSELATERWETHGMTGTKVHRTWCQMRRRCLDKNSKNYFRYGGRGIKICDRWLESFENFYADMGEPPSIKHSIDRINNNGNYEPSNCRWATNKQQNRNYSKNIDITIDNKTIKEM